MSIRENGLLLPPQPLKLYFTSPPLPPGIETDLYKLLIFSYCKKYVENMKKYMEKVWGKYDGNVKEKWMKKYEGNMKQYEGIMKNMKDRALLSYIGSGT